MCVSFVGLVCVRRGAIKRMREIQIRIRTYPGTSKYFHLSCYTWQKRTIPRGTRNENLWLVPFLLIFIDVPFSPLLILIITTYPHIYTAKTQHQSKQYQEEKWVSSPTYFICHASSSIPWSMPSAVSWAFFLMPSRWLCAAPAACALDGLVLPLKEGPRQMYPQMCKGGVVLWCMK